MIIDDNIGHFTEIVEGRDIPSLKTWCNDHAAQRESELRRGQLLRLKTQPFDEICRILDERGVKYAKSNTVGSKNSAELKSG